MKNGLYLADCFFIVSVLYITFLRQIRVFIKLLYFQFVYRNMFIGFCFLFCNRLFDFAADLFVVLRRIKYRCHPNGWQRYKLNRGGR